MTWGFTFFQDFKTAWGQYMVNIPAGCLELLLLQTSLAVDIWDLSIWYTAFPCSGGKLGK